MAKALENPLANQRFHDRLTERISDDLQSGMPTGSPGFEWVKDFAASENSRLEAVAVAGTEDAIDSRAESGALENFDTMSRELSEFDRLIKAHPEISSKLAKEGIDLEREKNDERESLKRSNPEMPEVELAVRASVSVYLNRRDAIYRAAPDRPTRIALQAEFEKMKVSARELRLPYEESIADARDIPSSDKRFMLATTSGSGFDTR